MPSYKVHRISELLESERDDSDPYGPWLELWENRFISVETGGHFPDITTPLEIAPGQTCYVVWVEWTQADSYGEARNAATDTIGIFLDQEVAEEMKDQVNHVTTPAFELEAYDGQIIKGFAPWIDFFDHLEEVHVAKAIMQLGEPEHHQPTL